MTSLATHQANAILHFSTIYHSGDPRDGVPALALDNLNSHGMRRTRRDLKAMMESGVEAFVLLGQNLSAAIHAQGDSRSKLIAKMACYLAWRAPSQRTAHRCPRHTSTSAPMAAAARSRRRRFGVSRCPHCDERRNGIEGLL